MKLEKRKKVDVVRKLNIRNVTGEKAIQYEVEIANRFQCLDERTEEQTPAELWQRTKNILLETAKEVIGYEEE